jgi:hypothetical protein
MFLKQQAAPIGIINVPTTCNHNIKSRGTNICNSFHCFYFLIRKFLTHKYFKFEHTSKLVTKFWPSILLLWIFVNLLTIVASRLGNHKDGSTISYQLLFGLFTLNVAHTYVKFCQKWKCWVWSKSHPTAHLKVLYIKESLVKWNPA